MRARWWLLVLAVPIGAMAEEPAPAPAPQPPGAPAAPAPPAGSGRASLGIATIAHARLEAHTTASGEQYNRNALAGAHRSLPFGTLVRVTNVKNQRSVLVRINDRAAGIGNRIIELTPRAAAMIGLHGISVGEVRVEVVGAGAGARPALPDAPDPAVPAVK
jgi:rare lipoprotein A